MVDQQTLSQHSRDHLGHGIKISNESNNDLGNYHDLLLAFLKKGYQFVFFPEISKPSGQLALRHDIDFDTRFALESAKIEADLGIKATYFFLLRSNFYNIFSPRDFDNINNIRELGHTIGIHFDTAIYEDIQVGLSAEINLFKQNFNVPVEIISLHRPSEFFQKYDQPIMGVEHTYQSKYFTKIKYCSDSTGKWRFGHPLQTEAFDKQATIHLLIHPIWWMVNGNSNLDKLENYYNERKQLLKGDFLNNCIPFQEISEKL